MNITALARHQVIALDGLSGSGKTTLAARLALELPHTVVAVESFVPGWHKLAEGVARVETELLAPYRRGEAATAATYDWEKDQWGAGFTLEPGTPILLEGCGAGAVNPELIDLLMWIDIEEDARLRQLDARDDYELYLPYRSVWHAQEVQLARRHRTKERADIVIPARRLRVDRFGDAIDECDAGAKP